MYLSLGDREERTRNPVMARVGEAIREAEDILKLQKRRLCEENEVRLIEWSYDTEPTAGNL